MNNFFKNKTVIDVGCGGGRYSNALKNLGAKKVYGVDYGSDGLKLAKKNYKKKNLIFMKQNVLNLTFAENKFDIVFCNGVLHHTSNIDKGIKELIRVCKPGGFIFLFLYGTSGLFWDARKRMNKLMKLIPEYYSQKVLDLIGLPSDRFIFMDTFYVPIEEHINRDDLLRIFDNRGIKYKQIISNNEFDLLGNFAMSLPDYEEVFGEAEHRYLIEKN